MRFEPGKIKDKKYCENLFKHYLKEGIIKKSESAFKTHINKAVSNLDFANFLMMEHDFSIKEKLAGKKYYDWCITIYYYAIYHAALSLLAKAGFKSKSHLATLTAITLFYYHKDNILNDDELNFLIDKITIKDEEIDLIAYSKEMREKACYGVSEQFDKSLAHSLKIQTADFINRIKYIIL